MNKINIKDFYFFNMINLIIIKPNNKIKKKLNITDIPFYFKKKTYNKFKK